MYNSFGYFRSNLPCTVAMMAVVVLFSISEAQSNIMTAMDSKKILLSLCDHAKHKLNINTLLPVFVVT